MRGVHLSWHPGPDPQKKPMGWTALCGVTLQTVAPSYDPILDEMNKGFTITPDITLVNCPECMLLYWSGEYTGFLSDKTPRNT